MQPPNPCLTLSALKFSLSVQDYQALIRRYTAKWGRFIISWVKDDFWQKLPRYQVAVCPFCRETYTEPLNTYGLDGWDRDPGLYESVYADKYQRCQHFVAVNSFVNLNGFIPDELETIQIWMDVPCITPQFLFDDPPCAVVLHSLPICRIEADAFVPRYLLYTLVYYSENAPLAIRKRSNLPDQFADDPEFFPATFTHPGEVWKRPELLDLESWARRGKLLWLDPDTLALASWREGATRFPYQNIVGHKWHFEIVKGKLHFLYGSPPSERHSA
jgi:hypothetical protein